jgi:hypothetical protein
MDLSEKENRIHLCHVQWLSSKPFTLIPVPEDLDEKITRVACSLYFHLLKCANPG